MTIYRTEHNKDNPYFMLNRAAIEDDRLSFKAIGILTYLLSKPDKWEVHEKDLVNRHTDGASAVRTGLRELADSGYFVKIQVRNDKNQITGWITEVHEIPIEQAKGEKDKFFHIEENPHSGNCTNRKTADIVSNDSLGSNEDSKVVSVAESTKPQTPVQPPTPLPLKNEEAPYPALRDMDKVGTAADYTRRRARSMKHCDSYKPEQHNALFETIVDLMKVRTLIDADDSRTIGDYQEVAVLLHKMGHSAESVDHLRPVWGEVWFNKDGNASLQQFKTWIAGQSTATSEKVKVSMMVTGSRGDVYEQVFDMDAAEAKKQGYTIVG